MDFEKARFNMVEQQIRPWDVLDPRVLDVISNTPRESFTPDEYKNLAYADTRIPLGDFDDHPCMMVNPNIQGRILQELNIQKDDLILEIGTGSGYLTACMAQLGRHVDTVDINEDLTEMATQNLQAMQINNVNLATGDAAKGWHQKASYDVIVIAAAMKNIPESYKQLLTTNGRMFVVTGQAPAMTAHLVTRTDKNKWTTQDLFETSIEPIIQSSDASSVKEKFEF